MPCRCLRDGAGELFIWSVLYFIDYEVNDLTRFLLDQTRVSRTCYRRNHDTAPSCFRLSDISIYYVHKLDAHQLRARPSPA